MISVGIDVSKRKSMAAIISLEGEVIHSPIEFEHTQMGLQSLLDEVASYPVEDVRFILESTGVYHLGILNYLTSRGYFVHVANPMLMKKYFDVTYVKGKQIKKMRGTFPYAEVKSGIGSINIANKINHVMIYKLCIGNIFSIPT